MEDVKITYIGGGSQQWALHLMADLALSKSLSGTLTLYDIDNEAAEKNKEISANIFGRPEANAKFKVEVEPDLDTALKGSDFVVISIEPGPTEKRFIDLKIPEKYGIFQSVGDTIGPGGMARAVRSLPVMADFAHHIMAVCPDAWVINYTNPMTWCTAALFEAEPEIKAVGCCHEVFHTQEMLGRWVRDHYKVDLPKRHDIVLDISGVNHFTFATRAMWNGQDILGEFEKSLPALSPEQLTKNALEREAEENWFDCDFRVATDFLKRFGVLGAAGDRHLAEFVPWYLKSKEELNSWGVAITPYEWRVRRSKEQDKARKAFLEADLKPSGEEGVKMIEALAGADGATCRTQCNLPNIGQNDFAPEGHIVESYGLISKNKIEPVACGVLPESVQSLESRIMTVQGYILEGIMNEDKATVYEGFALDPLNSLTSRKSEELFDELFEALEVNWG
ncbi:alpha-galactosidase [Martelella radicis]|uniref:Alpha-galactosidase n=1 Tax=Martelella radicis TaxID=1397476 RepID=A0A7W6PAU3_9HYPH|nr:alpha-galactosidase [Martelella radicis]MBB4123220.1 alpha-galactosidase [Martelella radicis]